MYKPKVTKENPVVETRFIIDNGFDYFFQDEKGYEFNDVEGGMMSMIKLAKEHNWTTCKLISEIVLKNDDYIQKIISTYKPKNIFQK